MNSGNENFLYPLGSAHFPYKGKPSKNDCGKFEIQQIITSANSPRLRGDVDRQWGKKTKTMNQQK